eukprot:Nk52_evm90s224 gene=Nk52_evmTU90s224
MLARSRTYRGRFHILERAATAAVSGEHCSGSCVCIGKHQSLLFARPYLQQQRVGITTSSGTLTIPIWRPIRDLWEKIQNMSGIKHTAERDSEGEPEAKKIKVWNLEDLLLKEEDVGIEQYVGKHEGIFGIIKQRYTDFLVNEIDMDGNIVHLTDVTTLPDPEEGNKVEAALKDFSMPKEFTDKCDALSEEAEGEFYFDSPDDKEERFKVHQFVRANYPKLGSSVEDVDGVRKFKIVVTKGQKKRRSNAILFPKGKPYTTFVLYKENRETMNAVGEISQFLNCKPRTFTWAGTKDKRGCTVQLMSGFKVDPRRLKGLNGKIHGLCLGNFRFSKTPLKLGNLKGNHFGIVLRNITTSKENIEMLVASLTSVGFINYFGMQRFGTGMFPTHHIGKLAIKRDYEAVRDAFLGPRDGKVFNEEDSWKLVWDETRDPQKTMDALNKSLRHKRALNLERTFLQALVKYPKNISQAFEGLPRNTRTLFPHSYQSLVFNKMTSERIRRFGLKPALGDIVILDRDEDLDKLLEDEETISHENDLKKIRVVEVTEENISKVTIHDVVLPLPGFAILYPPNLKEEYMAMLEKDGISPKNMEHYALSGSYRPIVLRPTNVSWKTLDYKDKDTELVRTERDEVLNSDKTIELGGDSRALSIQFSLPPSTYATMCLREITKADTSKNHQISINS